LFCDFAADAESALDEDADGADTITAFLFSYLLFLTPFIIPIVNAVAVLPVKGIPRFANVVDVIGKI
jgi:hypothetical protein